LHESGILHGDVKPPNILVDDRERGRLTMRSRPAAKHVIERSLFFAILNDVRMSDSRVCLLCEMNGDDSKKDADAGIECSEGHFTCGSCVTSSRPPAQLPMYINSMYDAPSSV
jgi:serine/threonine protein kinase